MACSLCFSGQDDILWQDGHCRVVLVPNPDYPGYCRVIWHKHVAEMTDLDTREQHRFMDVALAVERALRVLMTPDKINLASLGNQVPHLHWHVIARFADDRHFPESIWGREQRQTPSRAAPDRTALAGQIAAELALLSITC